MRSLFRFVTLFQTVTIFRSRHQPRSYRTSSQFRCSFQPLLHYWKHALEMPSKLHSGTCMPSAVRSLMLPRSFSLQLRSKTLHMHWKCRGARHLHASEFAAASRSMYPTLIAFAVAILRCSSHGDAVVWPVSSWRGPRYDALCKRLC